MTNQKHYVGITKHDIVKRFLGHCMSARSGSQFALHKAMMKYGCENFSIEVLEICQDRQSACSREIELIFELKTHLSHGGYNMTQGGEGMIGLSQESIERMAHAHRRENLSIDTLHRMRSAKLGRTLSQETKDKMTVAHTGKTFTTDHKEKIGRANSGINVTESKRKKLSISKSVPVDQIDLEGQFIMTHPSIKIAAERTGIHWTNISGCCNGTRKTAGCFRWKHHIDVS